MKWVAKLGSASYGNVTVASGRVFVGTNNASPRDPKYRGDCSILMCLDEQTDKLLWQLAVPKLAAGKGNDWEEIGICSSPTVDGDHLYLVTNRCEAICLDVRGQANGVNRGPFTDEAQYTAGPGKPPVPQGPGDADILWRYDMRDELVHTRETRRAVPSWSLATNCLSPHPMASIGAANICHRPTARR